MHTYQIKFSIPLLMAASALASGCQPKTTAIEPIHADGTCNSEAVSHFAGKKATPELLEQARNQSGAKTARILGPDDIVTLEYNSQRLNINTDASMTIERISCG
ncbi:I78 family peptidase inhibitor [Pseudomonas stutzeri]|uniref:Peptidase inhibitor I78 family protein n=1 Tax=Stutzerimonas stutzeri TaxID=316 RepID=A0A2N8S7V2_STUST|nr:I78 family peptidase inhibitor [Stutzerimonas stutzeri]MCQ4295010.1 I78 family peptidase inhibitor [Stutzerimonas stutzeri]PNF82688.1 peptidase inhibitor I78 family protein [Stutzerimonas stutzeri]